MENSVKAFVEDSNVDSKSKPDGSTVVTDHSEISSSAPTEPKISLSDGSGSEDEDWEPSQGGLLNFNASFNDFLTSFTDSVSMVKDLMDSGVGGRQILSGIRPDLILPPGPTLSINLAELVFIFSSLQIWTSLSFGVS